MVVLRNRWTNQVLLIDDSGALRMGAPGPNLDQARWTMSKDPFSMAFTLANVAQSTKFIVLRQGSLQLGALTHGSKDGLWTSTAVANLPDAVRIQSAAVSGQFLNIEKGQQPQSSTIFDSWWSAQWYIDADLTPDARSVHLAYSNPAPSPAGPDLTQAYNEVQILESHPSSYFMALGFEGGYFGVQQLDATNWQVRFSIWDNSTETDRSKVALADRATEVQAGKAATVQPFPGKGEGGAGLTATMPITYKTGDVLTFWVKSQPMQDGRTYYTAKFGQKGMTMLLLAEISRPAQGRWIRGLYSFVEDFLRNGADPGVAAADRSPYQMRTAIFQNIIVQPLNLGWYPVTQAQFTAWSPQPLVSINGSDAKPAAGTGFRLDTGGNTVQNTPLDSTVSATGTPAPFPQLN